MRLPLGVLLLSAVAFAQSANPRRVTVQQAGLETTAALTLYVDPVLGADIGACTAAGAAACKTVAGALALVPARVKHNVTVNLASGTYTDATIKVEGFNIDNGVTLTLQGAQIAFTVATGASTGTLTGVTAGSTSTTRATVVDSGQTWTTNDLRGRFFRTTSGAGTSTYYPIISNTATDIVLATNSSNVAVSNTYEIITPGAIFSFTAAGQIKGNNGGGSVQVTDVTLGSSTNVWQLAEGTTTFRRARMVTTSTLPISATSTSPTAGACVSCYISNDGSTGAVSIGGGNTFTLATSYVRSTSTGTLALLQATDTSKFTLSSGTFESASTAAGSAIFSFRSTAISTAAGFYDCSSANQTAIHLPGSGLTSASSPSGSVFFSAGPVVNGCGTAIHVNRQGAVEISTSSSGLAVSNATTAFHVSDGGRIYFNTKTPTFTTVTNEIMLDGVGAAFATLVTYLTNAEYSILYR